MTSYLIVDERGKPLLRRADGRLTAGSSATVFPGLGAAQQALRVGRADGRYRLLPCVEGEAFPDDGAMARARRRQQLYDALQQARADAAAMAGESFGIGYELGSLVAFLARDPALTEAVLAELEHPCQDE